MPWRSCAEFYPVAAPKQGNWGEYRQLVVEELKRLSLGIETVNRKIDDLRSADIAEVKAQIAVLQFKSGVWGFIAGAVPSAVAIAYIFLSK